MIAPFCVEAVAESRRDALPPVEGRWVAERRNLTIDVSRCGAGWCGVEVSDGKTCGAIALRFELIPGSKEWPQERLSGRLELASDAQRYAVVLNFFQLNDGDPVKLIISGNPGDQFEPWRRNFPFRELLARAGDAMCPPVAKVS